MVQLFETVMSKEGIEPKLREGLNEEHGECGELERLIMTRPPPIVSVEYQREPYPHQQT